MFEKKMNIDQKYFDEIKFVKNVLPEELYEQLWKKYKNPSLTYGWKSNEQRDDHGHWNVDIAKFGVHNTLDVSKLIPELDQKVWQHLRSTYEMLKDTVLIRCYINGHTFGVEGYFHRDSGRQDETTIVMYLTDGWSLDWAGETVFANEEDVPEIVSAVLPAKNAAVMFNSNIRHCGRAVSRKCNGIRLVYVMKTRKIRSETYEKLSKFLYENGAIRHKHEKGNLHDHLLRVYSLLSNRGFEEDVCLGGGLHSVFGTNAFKNNIFTEKSKDKVADNFGKEPMNLALIFSNIDRPSALEYSPEPDQKYVNVKLNNGKTGVITKKRFEQLQLIECANLFDQNFLKKDSNPILYKIWHGDQNLETHK